MIGKVLNNRYKVVEKVGEGGMAAIYRAQDTRLKRDVAIKVLHNQLAREPEVLSRFVREAQSAAKLVHPNIVSVFDIEEFEGVNYIVMEFIDAPSLKEVIQKQAPFDFATIHQIFEQVTRAVKYAHENGIIHRDLKPQNVLMANGIFVKVTDFGIARALTSASLTQTGTMMGSVQYFSPEQAQGKPVDKTADIYSLGIMLFECLTGRLPFEGDNPVTVALKQVQDEPPPPSRYNENIPPELDEVVLKALLKDPAERYQDADEFFEALDEVLLESESYEKPRHPVVGMGDTLTQQTLIAPAIGSRATVDEDEEEEEEEEEVAAENRSGNFIFIVVFLVFLIVVTGFFIERGLLFHGFRNDAVPDLEGYTLDRARIAADAKGWSITVAEEAFNPKVPEGVIISQTPKAGATLNRGGVIKVVISKGKPSIEVTDLTGMSKDRAMQELERLGLRGTVEKTVASDRYEKDVVVSQEPQPSETAAPGNLVRLVVSKGTEKIEVPNLVGMLFEDAKKMVAKKNLQVIITDEKSSDREPDGAILTQKPVAGGMVETDTKIEVVVARRDTTVKTPDLTGKTIAEAQNFLESMGITLNVSDETSDTSQIIQGQDPAPGTGLPRNKTIKVWTQQWIVVPNLTGKSLEDAQNAIDRAGLTMGDIAYTPKSGAEGTIIDQSPRSGVEVEKGTRVDITIGTKMSGTGPVEQPSNTSSPKNPTVPEGNL